MIDRTTAPSVKPFGLLTIPEEEVIITPSGATLHLLNGGNQNACRISFMWPGGVLDAMPPILPTFAAEMLREGCEGMTGAEIADCLDFNSAILGSNISNHYTGITVTLLNNKADKVIPVLAKIIATPTFPAQAFDAIQRRTISNLKVKQAQVSWSAAYAMTKLIAGDSHPMSCQPDAETYSSVTIDQVADYYKRMAVAPGFHIYASGCITDEIKSLLYAFIEALPAGIVPAVNYVALCPQQPQTVFTEKADSLQSAVAMALPAIDRKHPEYINLQLATWALGGYFGSRLMLNIREDKGYTYGITAGLNGSQEGGYTTITAQCDPAYTNALIEEVKHELTDLAVNPPCGDELQRLKLNAATKLAATLDSPFSVMDFHKLKLLVDTPADYFDARQRAIAELTPEKISQLAQVYLRPDDLRISVAGPKIGD
jgi:predicted Zn-dependent peptidase